MQFVKLSLVHTLGGKNETCDGTPGRRPFRILIRSSSAAWRHRTEVQRFAGFAARRTRKIRTDNAATTVADIAGAGRTPAKGLPPFPAVTSGKLLGRAQIPTPGMGSCHPCQGLIIPWLQVQFQQKYQQIEELKVDACNSFLFSDK